MVEQTKNQRRKIKIIPVQPLPDGELSEQVSCKCCFCEKDFDLTPFTRSFARLSESKRPYCNFCLRNNFHTRHRRNVLLFSFRGLFGYYYHQLYGVDHHFYLSEIGDLILDHERAGLLNPLFSYDPDSLIWAVDFSRVGNAAKQIKIDEVLQTVVNILFGLNLDKHVPSLNVSDFYEAFRSVIVDFHENKSVQHEILIPIPLASMSLPYLDKGVSPNRLRDFIPKEMLTKT